MKFIIVIIGSLMFATISGDMAQFPDASLKNLEGKTVKISDITSLHEKTIISFWASWCKPCKLEMDAIGEVYDEWQEKYDTELVAITIDNARGLAKVPGIAAAKDWPYKILSDSNQELMMSLNFQTIPQTFVVNREGKIIYSHSGYTPGDEDELEAVLRK